MKIFVKNKINLSGLALCLVFVCFIQFESRSQNYQTFIGKPFPQYVIGNISNAPVKSLNIHESSVNKFYILNFWGTWCSPCIPEMDSLKLLQQSNASKLQIIAISDDSQQKLKNYLKKYPTNVWLARDEDFYLYNLFEFSSVGHSAIVDPNGHVVAFVKTHSINQTLLDDLFNGKPIMSDASHLEKIERTEGDLFGVDSLTASNFSLRAYMRGQQSRGLFYKDDTPFKNRRVTFINVTPLTMYKAAFNIVSQKQVIYEEGVKDLLNYENKDNLYSLDILVPKGQESTLMTKLQSYLNKLIPVKARLEERQLDVYVLKNKNFKGKESAMEKSYSFNGNGFSGKAISIAEFADHYLSNEFDLPVLDNTNIKGLYDIELQLNVRTVEELRIALEKMGFYLEKTSSNLPVLVFSKENL